MDDIKAKAFKLFIEGKTYQEIGDLLGVSRQRIQQIVRPPKPIYDAVKRRNNGKCEACGILCSGHVHHANGGVNNFNDMGNLEYLCPSCHRKAHGLIGGKKTLRAIRIEEEDLKELERLGKKDDRTVSYLIQRAIREFIRREKAGK